MGEAPGLNWPSAKNSVMKNRFDFIKSLPKFGFKSVVDYEEVCYRFRKGRRLLFLSLNKMNALLLVSLGPSGI
jgi:hypothetical protein